MRYAVRIAESASHQIFERSRRRGVTPCGKFASVSMIITKLNAIEPSGSLVKLECRVFRSSEVVTALWAGDFTSSRTIFRHRKVSL